MRNTATLIVAVLVLGLTTGCAVDMWGFKAVAGNGLIGEGCDPDGACKDVVKGGEMSMPFADVTKTVVGGALRMADAVPFVELGNPDELTVRLVEVED